MLTFWFTTLAARGAQPAPAVQPAGSETVEVDAVHDPREAVPGATVVPIDERIAAGEDLAEVLEGVAGASVRRLGGLGDIAQVGLRGSTARQVAILLDGIPLNPDGESVVNLAELPLAALGRVEVIRSAPPPELGTAPIGGVVNLVTRWAAAPVFGRVGVGSWGTQLASAAAGEAGAGPQGAWERLLAVDLLHTEGDHIWFDDGGTPYNLLDDHLRTRENNDKGQLSALGRWRVRRGSTELVVLAAPLVRSEGLPGPGAAPTTRTRLETARNLLALEARGRPGFVRAWDHLRRERLDDALGELGLGRQVQADRLHSLGALAHLAPPLHPRLAPALTLSLRREAFARVEGEGAEPASRLAGLLAGSARIYALGERLRLEPVLQASGAVEAGEVAWRSLDPRIALDWRQGGWSARATAGRYLRPPTFTELHGDRGASAGNPELLPERGASADLSARAVGRAGPLRWALEGAAWWREAEDLVVWVQNAQRTLVPVNLDAGRLRGLEFAADLALDGAWDAGGHLARTWAEDAGEDPDIAGRALPGIPAWDLGVRAGLHRADRWRLGYSFSWTSAMPWDEANWSWAPPRPLHGAYARLRIGEGPLEVEFTVLNLADTIAEVAPRNPLDPGSEPAVQAVVDYFGYPLPGRTCVFTLTWRGRCDGGPCPGS